MIKHKYIDCLISLSLSLAICLSSHWTVRPISKLTVRDGPNSPVARQADRKRKAQRNEAVNVFMFYHIILILFNNIHFSPSPVAEHLSCFIHKHLRVTPP